MGSFSKKSGSNSGRIIGPSGADSVSDATAKDLVVPLPEFLQEIHGILGRAEQAYTQGNLKECVRYAEEGLAAFRLPLTKLVSTPIPQHYALFFQCFRHLDEYRTALALFKQGLLSRRRAEPEAGGARSAWRRAWELLETHFSGFDERLTLAGAHHDFPVAGRVLRGILRLRVKLREGLNEA